jgi:DNA-binding protein H-NS
MATTYAAIQRQIAVLQKKAAEARQAELAKVISGIRKQIAQFGLTPADLFDGAEPTSATGATTTAGKKSANPPKYRDPKTGKTWTGFGKAPGWLAPAMKAGKADAFLITTADRAPTEAARNNAVSAPARKAPAVKPAEKAAEKPSAGAGRKRASAKSASENAGMTTTKKTKALAKRSSGDKRPAQSKRTGMRGTAKKSAGPATQASAAMRATAPAAETLTQADNAA